MAIGIGVKIRNRIIVEARTDIINHLNIQALDVWKLEERGRMKKRRIKIVNVYDNHFQVHLVWIEVGRNTRRRALTDTDWNSIIEYREILLGDLNANRLEGNVYCGERRDTAGLQRLVETYDLIRKNKPETATWPTWWKMTLFIDLTYMTSNKDPLHT